MKQQKPARTTPAARTRKSADPMRLVKAQVLADLYVLAEAKAANLDGWKRLVQCFLDHPEMMKSGGAR